MARTEAQKQRRRELDRTPEGRAKAKVIADRSRGKRREENREYQREYRKRNRAILLAKQKEYNERPEVKARVIAQNKFKQLQNFVINDCPICGRNSRLVWDHDHETDEFREYICGACNTMLGFARDSVTILTGAIEYLNKHNTRDKYGT